MIQSSIDENSTYEEIRQACSYVMGQTTANVDMEIRDYFDRLPMLEELSNMASDLDWHNTSDQREDWNSIDNLITEFTKAVSKS